MRFAPLLLIVAVGALPPVASAGPRLQLVELPGTEALPPTPPLAPPQPPLVETPRLRGTVGARTRVNVAIDAQGAPHRVAVEQRLRVRALGDYTFLIPAPATSVEAAPGSGSQPGFRPNQIVWQGFSPRRKLLAARAELRLADSVASLPIRVRVSGAPTRPGPFELVVTLENATRVTVEAFHADAVEADVAAALDALRAAARIGRAVEGQAVRIRGPRSPLSLEAAAALAIRGTITFPPGSVREPKPARFSGVLGGDAFRTTVRGVALRPATPRLRVVAEPIPEAAVPEGSAPPALENALDFYVRYARTRQYQAFLANPDPQGPSATTYVFETAEPERATPQTDTEPSNDPLLPLPVIAAGLALLGLGLVVLWAHL